MKILPNYLNNTNILSNIVCCFPSLSAFYIQNLSLLKIKKHGYPREKHPLVLMFSSGNGFFEERANNVRQLSMHMYASLHQEIFQDIFQLERETAQVYLLMKKSV